MTLPHSSSKRALLLILSLALGGCKAPCKPDTVTIELSFDQTTAAADSLVVTAIFNGQSVTKPTPHTPGATAESLELDLPNYVAGSGIDVTVVAQAANATIGQGSLHGYVLADACSVLSLAVTSGATAPADMSTSDQQPGLDL
jgi:hypothetical protein